MNKKPVVDLHCDLTSYLTKPQTTYFDDEEIGCSLPHLQSGNVKLQIMAFFAPTEKNSSAFGIKQSEIFADMKECKDDFYVVKKEHLNTLSDEKRVGIMASIESGSAFCDEDMPLSEGFKNYEIIEKNAESILYVSFTHHAENRFGGGNYTKTGLKNDGKKLVEFLAGKKTAIDFSHTSDALANDILTFLSKENLDIPVIASHSNYRSVLEHPRNLPDDIAKEIINKDGIIGLNLVRAFLDPDNPETLLEHIEHGLKLGGENNICFGADYFYTKSNTDESRLPFYFKQHEDAGCYPSINKQISDQFDEELADKISSLNALQFIKRIWSC